MAERSLKSMIDRVMERCASERFITADKIVAARRELREKFPDLEFDFDNNAFYDPAANACGTRLISDLASTKRPYIKRFQKEERGKIGALVSKTYNATKEVMARKISAVDEIYDHVLLDLEERKKSPFANLLNDVIGTYALTSNLEFYIGGSPIDLLQKSTGMPWETASCEAWGRESFEGVYDDIKIGNMVCILQSRGGKKKYARVMLRWCYADNKTHPALGIEELWYYANDEEIGSSYRDDKKKVIAPQMTAFDATSMLEKILSDLGYLDYTDCITPYTYGGYSDTAGHNVNIRYKKRR